MRWVQKWASGDCGNQEWVVFLWLLPGTYHYKFIVGEMPPHRIVVHPAITRITDADGQWVYAPDQLMATDIHGVATHPFFLPHLLKEQQLMQPCAGNSSNYVVVEAREAAYAGRSSEDVDVTLDSPRESYGRLVPGMPFGCHLRTSVNIELCRLVRVQYSPTLVSYILAVFACARR